MMFEDLIEYYKNNLTFKELVLNRNKRSRNITISLLVLSFILFIASISISIFNVINHLYFSYWTGLLSILAALIIFFNFNWANKINIRIIKNSYEEVQTFNNSWNVKDFNRLIVNKLEIFIYEMEINDVQLSKMQQLLEKKMEMQRKKLLIIASAIGVLFIPIWNNYLSKVFDLHKLYFNLLSRDFILFSLLVILFGFVIRPVISQILENIISSYYHLEKLNDLLNEILLKRLK